MKCICNEGEGVGGSSCCRKHEFFNHAEIFLPTMSSTKKNIVSSTIRVIMREDFENLGSCGSRGRAIARSEEGVREQLAEEEMTWGLNSTCTEAPE